MKIFKKTIAVVPLTTLSSLTNSSMSDDLTAILCDQDFCDKGFISEYHVGPLVSIKRNMTGKEYLKILKEEVWPELYEAKRIHPGHWLFMQDNAPVHRSKANTEFLASTGIDTIDWPPYSPDLNPIENVWNKNRLAASHEQFGKCLHQYFYHIA